MRAVVLGDDGTECLAEIPDPQPHPDEVVLRVDYCGICGSDLHAQHQGFSTGIALGHEFAGAIVELGREVTGWTVGDRVCVNPNGDWCGHCGFCRAGQHNLCTDLTRTGVGAARNGGMAPYVALPTRVLHRLPDAVSARHGAWVEPLATALRAVRTSGIGMGDPAIVFGAGPIGLLVITLLRAMGAGTITAFEPSVVRGAIAKKVGADQVVDPIGTDPALVFPDSAAAPLHAFECSGVASATEAALTVLRPRGVLTVTGVGPKSPHYRAADLVCKELTIRGSFIYTDEFTMAIDLLARGIVDVEPLTSGVSDINAGPDAFAEMRHAADLVKILLSAHQS